jgi:excisionase family DNA binding protein
MAQQPARPQLLTPGEVAEQLRVSSMTVYRLLKSGELRSARIGKSFRILQSDVDAYLEDRFSDAG